MAQIESNAEYGDPFWIIVRGEAEPASIRNYVLSGDCCSDSGVTMKIVAYFRTLEKSEWDEEMAGLVETLGVMRDAYLGMCLIRTQNVAFGV